MLISVRILYTCLFPRRHLLKVWEKTASGARRLIHLSCHGILSVFLLSELKFTTEADAHETNIPKLTMVSGVCNHGNGQV